MQGHARPRVTGEVGVQCSTKRGTRDNVGVQVRKTRVFTRDNGGRCLGNTTINETDFTRRVRGRV